MICCRVGFGAGVASAWWVCDLVLLSPSVACGVVMVDPVGARVVSSVWLNGLLLELIVLGWFVF